VFLTSVDRVDDFIYEVYMVPEEFRRRTNKGGSAGVPEGGTMCPRAAPPYGSASRMGLGPIMAGAPTPQGFLNWFCGFGKSQN